MLSVSKLDALDSILDVLDSILEGFEDRDAKFEFRGTVNLLLHGTVRIQLHVSFRENDGPDISHYVQYCSKQWDHLHAVKPCLCRSSLPRIHRGGTKTATAAKTKATESRGKNTIVTNYYGQAIVTPYLTFILKKFSHERIHWTHRIGSRTTDNNCQQLFGRLTEAFFPTLGTCAVFVTLQTIIAE